jgi:riboflavin kinase/FMN adenylyltransferase
MEVFNSLDEIKDIRETVIALGNFDGVHIGHQELIKRTVESAKVTGQKSAVFTFVNHPKNIIAGKPVVKNILYLEDKIEIIRSLGVDYLFSLEFDQHIMHLSAYDFIDKLLLGAFRMKEAYCGFNYHFGYKAEGNSGTLLKAGAEKGFKVHILEPFKINNHLVSSTFIRNLIATGQIEECATYMGRNYYVCGQVIVGNKIGRTLGFPTLNILTDSSMVTPSHGVYITNCTYNSVQYKSITNVGVKPTVGAHKKNIETHIFDFNDEIYGKDIKVEFLKRLRPEIKFENIEALRTQIAKDCEDAKKYHGINIG